MAWEFHATESEAESGAQLPARSLSLTAASLSLSRTVQGKEDSFMRMVHHHQGAEASSGQVDRAPTEGSRRAEWLPSLHLGLKGHELSQGYRQSTQDSAHLSHDRPGLTHAAFQFQEIKGNENEVNSQLKIK